MRWVLAALLWGFAVTAAVAQQPFTVTPPQIGGATNLAVSTNSARVQLPITPAAQFPAVVLFNDGTVDAFYIFGGSSIVATTSNTVIPPGFSACVNPINAGNFLAAITSTGSTTLRVSQQSSCPSARNAPTIVGAITPGDCALFFSANSFQDSGLSCNGTGPGIFGSLQIHNPAQSWNFTFDASQNFGSGSVVNALKICSTLPCSVPTWITDYGFLKVGNILSAWPNLSGGLSDTTGPLISGPGDSIFGDHGQPGGIPQLVVTSVTSNAGVCHFTISSDPTGFLANGVNVWLNAPGTTGCTGTFNVANYVANTSFDASGSTFGGTYSSGGWFSTGQDVGWFGRHYGGAIPNEGVFANCLSPQSDRTTGSGAAQNGCAEIVTVPNSSLTRATIDPAGNSDPGSIWEESYCNSGDTCGISHWFRVSAGNLQKWSEVYPGSFQFNFAAPNAPANGIYLEQRPAGANGVVAVAGEAQVWLQTAAQTVASLGGNGSGNNNLSPGANNGSSLGASSVAWNALWLGGSSSGASKVVAPASGGGTATLFTGSDIVVGRATTDTLTNKTISGASNTLTAIANASLTNSATTVAGATCTLGSTCGLSTFGTVLAGDTAFGNTGFTDGPSVSLGSTGTFDVSAQIQFYDTTTGAGIQCQVVDNAGTVYAANYFQTGAANAQGTMSLNKRGIVNPSGNLLKIQCKDNSANAGVMAHNITGTSKDTQISVTRVN